jgi:beta-galactosidase/beta-glucuronidase
MATELLTPWGTSLDTERPLCEYPRPQLVRDSFLCLNGPWEYAITAHLAAPAEYDGRIVVPFAPESALSGVGRVLQPDEVLHYRRSVTIPPEMVRHADDRLLLHLGAVDQWCRVELDGRVVGEHSGGYLPVTCDITAARRDGPSELRVTVRDPSDTGVGTRGKQRLHRGGIWYTPHSGIWQTAWVEAVPALAVDRLVLVPDLASSALDLTVEVAHGYPDSDRWPAACTVVVRGEGREVARAAGPPGERLRLPIPHVRPWSPEDPFLYDIEVSVGRDVVTSYVGMRSFGLGPDERGHPRLLLNGRPYQHVGVLDQGYWSDGLVTPPSDEAMVHDIATMKRLGFTVLRKHVKVEPLRWYHHCDRLGMLVWQDLVNGGGPYPAPVVTGPAIVPLHLPDRLHRLFGRSDPSAREAWLREMRATVELLRNVVSLAMWVPFNEGWGQFDSARVSALLRRLDPTRTIDHASGWHDQGAGDVTSRHVYVKPFRLPRVPRSRRHRALALTEYGGYSWSVPGHSASAHEYGYRRYSSAEDLAQAFTALHTEQVVPAVPEGLAATVYTQLSDVEDETNGLLTFDRRVQKIPDEIVQAVTAALRRSG